MMDNRGYQVLARKWRPQRFEDVVGQRPVVQTLANALQQGRTAHAYCFSGIRGVGKTTVARLLAKGLNCRAVQEPTEAPCGQCESCTEIMASRSMDVFERDAASDRGINEMKELIEIARYAPARDRYKVMILDEAHMLTPEASNALLKVLEEPPRYIVFVLATTEPNKILPTILSRCQHYQFGRISQREITDHLRHIAAAESVTVSDDGLALVATAADGSLRDAQSLLDKLIAFAGSAIDEETVVDLLGLVDRVLLFRVTELISAQDLPGVLGFVNEMVETGVDLHQFTIDLLGHMRNLLVVRTVDEPGDILHLPEGDVARLRAQAGAFEVDDLDRAFSLLAANEYRIKMAEQPRYQLEVVLARLARMPRLEPIEDLLAALRGDDEPPRGRSGDDGPTRRSGSTPPPRQSTTAPAPEAAAPPPTAAAATTPPKAAAEPEPTRATTAPPAPPATATSPKPAAEPEPRLPATASPTPAAVPTSPEPAAEAATVSPGAPAARTTPRPIEEPPPLGELLQPPGTSPRPPAPAAPDMPAAAAHPRRPATTPTTPLPEPPTGAPTEPAAEEPTPPSVLLQRIQQHVNEANPLIAPVLGRTSGISISGERIVFQFPASASIFADRVREPAALQLLAAAAEKVLRRSVIARIEIDAGAAPGARLAAGAPPEPGMAGADATPTDATPTGTPSSASPAVPTPAVSEPGGTPPPEHGAAPPAEPEATTPDPLRARAENEPRVQEFVKALRGQITSVEEL